MAADRSSSSSSPIRIAPGSPPIETNPLQFSAAGLTTSRQCVAGIGPGGGYLRRATTTSEAIPHATTTSRWSMSHRDGSSDSARRIGRHRSPQTREMPGAASRWPRLHTNLEHPASTRSGRSRPSRQMSRAFFQSSKHRPSDRPRVGSARFCINLALWRSPVPVALRQ